MAKKKRKPPAWNPSPRVRAFLAAYRRTANVTRAAKAAGIAREAHYRLLERSASYQAVFASAGIEAGQTLEDEAVRRAVEGVRRPLFYHGAMVTVPKDPSDPDGEWIPVVEREYSDMLLLALLKAKKPKEYKDRVEHDLGAGAKEGAQKFVGTMQDLLELYRSTVADEK